MNRIWIETLSCSDSTHHPPGTHDSISGAEGEAKAPGIASPCLGRDHLRVSRVDCTPRRHCPNWKMYDGLANPC